jgi:large subunit ribosomal protein L25
MDTYKLTATDRKITGHKVKQLRRDGLIPANIYGQGVKSTSITLKHDDFAKVFKKAGETGILEVTIGKVQKPVLIHNIQTHPVTGEILHIDLLQVNMKQKVTTNIPVEVVGESPAQKSGQGTVVVQLNEVEIEALPGDLPEKFEVDATKLTEVNQAVTVGDLNFDKSKIEVKTDLAAVVVKVEPPQKEEVVVAPVVTETPVEGEAPKEGETPAEGQTPAETSKEESK